MFTMWTSHDTIVQIHEQFSNGRSSIFTSDRLSAITRMSQADSPLTMSCDDVRAVKNSTIMDSSCDHCTSEEFIPPAAVPLTMDVSSLKITQVLPACHANAFHDNHPSSVVTGQQQSGNTHQQCLPGNTQRYFPLPQPVEFSAVGDCGELCSNQPAGSRALLTARTPMDVDKEDVLEHDSEYEIDIASWPTTIRLGENNGAISSLCLTDQASIEEWKSGFLMLASKQTRESSSAIPECALEGSIPEFAGGCPEGSISEHAGDGPEGSIPECAGDGPEGSISECARDGPEGSIPECAADCPESSVLECAGDCPEGSILECPGNSPESNVSECAGDCPEGSIPECAGGGCEGSIPECAGCCPEGSIPECVGDDPERSTPECAGHCPEGNISECAADCPESSVSECAGDSLEGSISECAGDCPEGSILECAGDCPEGSILECAGDCPEGSTPECAGDGPEIRILTPPVCPSNLPEGDVMSQNLSNIESVSEANIQSVTLPHTVPSVRKQQHYSSYSELGTCNLNSSSAQLAQPLSSCIFLCATKPLGITSLRSFLNASFDERNTANASCLTIVALIKQPLIVRQEPNLTNPSSALSIEPASKKQRIETGTMPVKRAGDDLSGSRQVPCTDSEAVSMLISADSDALVPSSSPALEEKVIPGEHTSTLSSQLLPDSPVQLADDGGAETQVQPTESDSDDYAVVPLSSNLCRQDNEDSDNDRVCPIRAGHTLDSRHIHGPDFPCEEAIPKTPTKSAESSAMTATLTTQTATTPPHSRNAQLVPPSPLLHTCPTLLISEDDPVVSMYNHSPDMHKMSHHSSETDCGRAVVPDTVMEEMGCEQSAVMDHCVPVWTNRMFPTDQTGLLIRDSVQQPSQYNLARPRLRLGLSRRQRCKQLHPSYQPHPL